MKNRKNKLTNLLKLGGLFFGISLFLWNCEKEDEFLETKTEIKKILKPFERLELSHLKNDKKFEASINKFNAKKIHL